MVLLYNSLHWSGKFKGESEIVYGLMTWPFRVWVGNRPLIGWGQEQKWKWNFPSWKWVTIKHKGQVKNNEAKKWQNGPKKFEYVMTWGYFILRAIPVIHERNAVQEFYQNGWANSNWNPLSLFPLINGRPHICSNFFQLDCSPFNPYSWES